MKKQNTDVMRSLVRALNLLDIFLEKEEELDAIFPRWMKTGKFKEITLFNTRRLSYVYFRNYYCK